MSVSRASAMGHGAPLTAQVTHHVLLTMWIAVLFSYRKRSCWARELHTGGHASCSSLCQLHSPLLPPVLSSFSSPRRGSSWWCSFSCHSCFLEQGPFPPAFVCFRLNRGFSMLLLATQPPLLLIASSVLLWHPQSAITRMALNIPGAGAESSGLTDISEIYFKMLQEKKKKLRDTGNKTGKMPISRNVPWEGKGVIIWFFLRFCGLKFSIMKS